MIEHTLQSEFHRAAFGMGCYWCWPIRSKPPPPARPPARLPARPPRRPLTDVLAARAGCRGPELHFQRVPGVVTTSVGFCNGKDTIQNPTYEAVCSGQTGARPLPAPRLAQSCRGCRPWLPP